MYKLLTFLTLVLCTSSVAQACVTYNPGSGTYTVSPDGSVIPRK